MSEFEDKPTIETGLYQHYKGNMYRVLGVGCHTETNDYLVVYTPAEPKADLPDFWLRPYAMFMETVEVDGEIIPRFKRIES